MDNHDKELMKYLEQQNKKLWFSDQIEKFKSEYLYLQMSFINNDFILSEALEDVDLTKASECFSNLLDQLLGNPIQIKDLNFQELGRLIFMIGYNHIEQQAKIDLEEEFKNENSSV